MVSKVLQVKINHAYDVLTLAAKMSLLYYQKPLMCCYSGGKDSDVLVQLALECLKPDEFEVLNSHTTVDSPETVYYIRERFEELRKQGIKCTVQYPTNKDGSPKSMWNLILKNDTPPTRLMRYCCRELKETSAPNRFIAVGVREDEGSGRKGRSDFATREATKKDAYYYYYSHAKEVFEQSERERESSGGQPNEADAYDCKFIEKAKQKKDMICNPIYQFTEKEVWELIKDRGLKYNPMYDNGYFRVGCLGCPLARKAQLKQFADYPKYKALYIAAFDRMLKHREAAGKKNEWKTGEEVFNWWIGKDELNGQLSLFDDMGGI